MWGGSPDPPNIAFFNISAEESSLVRFLFPLVVSSSTVLPRSFRFHSTPGSQSNSSPPASATGGLRRAGPTPFFRLRLINGEEIRRDLRLTKRRRVFFSSVVHRLVSIDHCQSVLSELIPRPLLPPPLDQRRGNPAGSSTCEEKGSVFLLGCPSTIARLERSSRRAVRLTLTAPSESCDDPSRRVEGVSSRHGRDGSTD